MSPRGNDPIVIADDDPAIVLYFKTHIEGWGPRTIGVVRPEDLAGVIGREHPCLLFLDLHFGRANGIEIMKGLLDAYPKLPIVIVTGDGSIEHAMKAIRDGAVDFLTKPVDRLRLEMIVRHCLEERELRQTIQTLRDSVEVVRPRLIGDSPAMRRIHELIAAVGPTSAPVLILGESGTGKELVARELHIRGPNPGGPFIAVNMAALPETILESTLFGHEKGSFTGADRTHIGSFEQAHRGTLFLDEIGEMPTHLQAKLLRFLQERTLQRVGSAEAIRVDCRVLAATNRDLEESIREGKFREDLYYRLNVVPIKMPPLRQRREDVALLASRFLAGAAIRHRSKITSFTPEALRALANYDWPGNVRQLENVVERVVILAGHRTVIDVEMLPEDVLAPRGVPAADTEKLSPMEDVERTAICDVLSKTRGKVRDAAQILGIGAATVYRKIKRYHIDLTAFGGETLSDIVDR